MANTNTSNGTTSGTTTSGRGIQLPCPCCGEESANVNLYLADGETFYCQECDSEFDRATVERFISKWTKVLKWVDSMPTDD